MIIKKEIPELNYLVERLILDEALQGTSPIIAGGSILFLYRFVTDSSDLEKVKAHQVLRNADKLSCMNIFGTSAYLSSMASKLSQHNGDVDIWFDAEESAMDFEARLISLCRAKPITSESSWAKNYFLSRKKNFAFSSFDKFQIIKKYYSSPVELISNFDFINCMIAWKDGVTYIDDRLDSNFYELSLSYNKDPFLGSINIASSLFNSLRAFKYSSKYSLNFSEDISKNIFKTLMELEDLDIKQYDKRAEFINSRYGKQYANSNSIKNMLATLDPYKIVSWANMPSFKKEYLLYMIGIRSEHMMGVRNIIEALVNVENKK